MRILTVISGITLAAAGVGCLAIYRSSFMGIAFVFGMAMIVSAVSLVSAYLIASKWKLPETVLAEGIITGIYGFAVLNNEINDNTMALFFGAWIVVCGTIRFTQSLTVSRFDRYNWPKILPLAIISLLVGLVMMMQSLISAANHMTLVGAAFILVGFSQLIYAMYMRPADTAPQAEQAKQRVMAKQQAAEEDRALRDELRSLNKHEREKRKLEIAIAKKAEREARKSEARARKKAEREARKSALEPTVPFSAEEIAAMQDAVESQEGVYPEDISFEAASSDENSPEEERVSQDIAFSMDNAENPASAQETSAETKFQFYTSPEKELPGKRSGTENIGTEDFDKMFEGSEMDFGVAESHRAETDTGRLPSWGEVLKDSAWDSSSKKRAASKVPDEPMFKKETGKTDSDDKKNLFTERNAEQEAALKAILEEAPIPDVLPDYTPVFNPEFVLSPEAEKIDEDLLKKPLEKEEPFTPFTAVTVADLNLNSDKEEPEQKEIDFTQEFSWTWHGDN